MEDVTVGVTASRRAEQLASALRRRGAAVTVGSTLGGDRAEPDDSLAAATDRIVDAAPEWLVATTGMGMRLWVEAATRTHRHTALRTLAAGATCVARGNKAVGGLARLDVEPRWVSGRQTDADVVAWLSTHVEAGDTVAVQLHGSPEDHPYGQLPDHVRTVTVTPYRSVLPEDTGPAEHLITATITGDVDVLTFTSPSAVRGLLAIADGMGPDTRQRLLEHVRESVAVATIGHVTGAALERNGLPPDIEPARTRTGAMVDAIQEWAR